MQQSWRRPAADAGEAGCRGVIARIEECKDDWCRLEVKGYEGWLKRTEIWGVDPTENFKE